MAVNVYKPHVIVMVEDDANRDIANGFRFDPNLNARNIQILNPSRGWLNLKRDFLDCHIADLQKYKDRHLVLLIDFDDQVEDRLKLFRNVIPQEVINRVYLLGTASEPEPLRKACGDSLEDVGKRLAAECFHGESDLWLHPLLAHNESERSRLNVTVRKILFS